MSITSKGQVGTALANAQTAHALRQSLQGRQSGQASRKPASMAQRTRAMAKADG